MLSFYLELFFPNAISFGLWKLRVRKYSVIADHGDEKGKDCIDLESIETARSYNTMWPGDIVC